MTASKTFLSLLIRIRRTIARTLRRVHVASCTFTLSLPPFVKIEIMTEQAELKAHKRRRR